jgi:hypothetical protein
MFNKIPTLVFAFAALFAVALAGPLWAQSDKEKKIDPDHLKAARAAIIATGSMEDFDNILPSLASRTLSTLVRVNPALAVPLEEVIADVALNLVKRRRELTQVLMGVWARRFTRDELVSITLFYKTPIGKKLVKHNPIIDVLSIGAAKKWSDSISEAMVTEVRKAMAARGHQI